MSTPFNMPFNMPFNTPFRRLPPGRMPPGKGASGFPEDACAEREDARSHPDVEGVDAALHRDAHRPVALLPDQSPDPPPPPPPPRPPPPPPPPPGAPAWRGGGGGGARGGGGGPPGPARGAPDPGG